MNNFSIRMGIKCLDILFLLILMIARTAMLGYVATVLAPMGWEFIKLTYYLNKSNWWESHSLPTAALSMPSFAGAFGYSIEIPSSSACFLFLVSFVSKPISLKCFILGARFSGSFSEKAEIF